MRVVTPEPWMAEAKCVGRDPNLYETKKIRVNKRVPGSLRQQAYYLCRGCPVMAECADYALRWKQTGVVHAGVPLGLAGENAQQYAELDSIRKKGKPR
ncbi:WhiB family transcriptional regulator [Nocardia sp. NPDC057440]|uniref:WhiB family transcriptional regulator n=1 Tax=Nocardia sp. NPDC057440 TaxID=3346134 RepID=UPI00366E8F21